jgi:hypothetical protein
MAQASSDWILILDADERVTEELRGEIKVKQGCHDGVRGLIVCVFKSMYTFVIYAKLWDATRQVASHPEVS